MSLTADRRDASGARAAGLDLTATRRVTWATVDTGFHVASTDGEFVGSVYATEAGSFVAFDGTSTPIGRFDSRAAAQSAVEAWEPPAQRARRIAFDRALLPTATVSAVVAVGLTVTAGLLAPLL
ncbi:peptide ABC transporter permease [Microbacterium sp. W1N]|uniref:peptide ABC transporter permease n=1 Tax=Microbacterium festucae TaxID=2977531 RepID=UPI0021BF3B10|nr:peptide ABC transporter permease [Microbacterium festucae]MCT9821259.1 peptide ABC transporter permease [Microbacterium festucae]